MNTILPPHLRRSYRRSHLVVVRAWLAAVAVSSILAGEVEAAVKDHLGEGAPSVVVAGEVFEDLNADGVRDPGEPGLADIRLSNGISIVSSDVNGAFTLTVERRDSRFVSLTLPSGYRATTPFFHRIGLRDHDTASFGLHRITDSAGDVLRFVHASDPQIADARGRDLFLEALGEIAALDPAVGFVVVSGDLVQTARDAHYELIREALTASPVPVLPAFGDHDADADGLRVRSYEQWIGPTCYSFERGGFHFVVLNDIAPVSIDGVFRQLDWLSADIAEAIGEVVIVKHFMANREDIELFESLGVRTVFSGHWHANRTRAIDEIAEFTTSSARFAGIDRSPPGFRVVEMGAGSVRATFRVSGVREHLAVVSPAAASPVPFGDLPVLVRAYDTRYPDLTVHFQVVGGDGTTVGGELEAIGGWSYRSTSPLSLAPGPYTLTVDAMTAAGPLATASVDFTVASAVLPPTLPGDAWSGFRGDPSGAAVVDNTLEIPLSLAWATHVGGPTGLGSPVVADGRVFVAHASPAAMGEAGLVCIDAADGEVLWRHSTASDVKGTPAVSADRVVLITSCGNVETISAGTGELLWSRALGDPAERFDVTSPTIVDGVVYVGGPSVTAALSLDGGDVLWQRMLAPHDFVATVYSAPAVEGERVALGLYSGLHVLDRSTGSVVWSRAAEDREAHRSPALVDGVLFAAGDTFGSQRLRAFDAETGAELWSAPYSVGNSNSAPAVTASEVIIGDGKGQVHAFGRDTGASLWAYQVGQPIASSLPYGRHEACVTGSPVILGDQVVIGADDGNLHLIGATSGQEMGRLDLGSPILSTIAASGNQLWVITLDGTLFSFIAGTLRGVAVGDAEPLLPVGSRLGMPWPNPARGNVHVPLLLAAASTRASTATTPVLLGIYDVNGRRVRTLLDRPMQAGEHIVDWDGRDAAGMSLAAGTYFLRLQVQGQTHATRVTLVR